MRSFLLWFGCEVSTIPYPPTPAPSCAEGVVFGTMIRVELRAVSDATVLTCQWTSPLMISQLEYREVVETEGRGRLD